MTVVNIFGDKVVIFGGDFRQIFPAVPRGTRSNIVHATINASYIWDHCKVLNLTKNMWLQSGLNLVNSEEIRLFSESKAIVTSIYPNLIQNYTNSDFLQCEVILASTIEIVDDINDYITNLLLGEYLSSDSIDRSDANDNDAFEHLTLEFLNCLKTSGFPNHSIKLKVDTTVMLIRNLDQSEGICNGTRLKVTRLANHVIESKIISGANIGNTIYIPRMSLSLSQSPWPFKLIRR
ncbi:uncharacterized protein LOC127096446 [Lathyrus oleraceus]|uniref:uncharacterized protein LOC127096446 n=1 Tax=Pisum sativum TaxID=3888 RepID=UPI0021D12759|nr:uncharacterized protein LOC127096446 [Pisum sativum]